MKKKGDEKNAKKTINPEDDDWEFARFFEDIKDSKKDKFTTSTWDIGEFMKSVKDKGRQAANTFRRLRNALTREKTDGQNQTSLKEMYIKGGMTITGASIWDQETGQHVFDMEGQHEVMIREWKKVFDKHKAAPPKWSRLEKEYGHSEPGTAGAPEETPPAELLYRRAQNAKDDTSGGSDGWDAT